MTKYISHGIDLGTTNSCVASFDGDKTQIYQNTDQMNVTPSVVRMEKNGRIIVGRRAYASRMASPENVAAEFKRWMGQNDLHTFKAAGKQLSAEALSAEVLKALMEDVRSHSQTAMESAVITVPAAFGHLQCEATARAAQLSGLKHSVLIQEPIAAAIAYGIDPKVRDQKWLVFDLGGGTFDVAIMSSRDGRLSVLEHKGNNHLGGKDIDRLVVEKLLWTALEEEFDLPDQDIDPAKFMRLVQRLHLKAEEAKIDLTRNTKVLCSLFDLGEDESGQTIEAEVEIKREDLERLCEPMVEKCLSLCEAAVSGARLSNQSLDKIVLVGGPTQMPFLRQALSDRFGDILDWTIDPMTVVAQGAAIHAASVEVPEIFISTPSNKQNETVESVVALTLAYEAVSPEIQATVEGSLENYTDNDLSIKIDSVSGHWTSGWLQCEDDMFEIEVSLIENKNCRYKIQCKDANGSMLQIEPDEFSIRHGLSLSSPPLPHTISTEIVMSEKVTELEPLFKRGSSLPIEVTKMFRANKTLRPSEDAFIAVKLWEGEALSDPEANELIATLLIKSSSIRRPIAEGSEIEVTVNVDISRRMSVSVFVPKLNEHFSEEVYLPKRDEKEFVEIARALPEQLESHFHRVAKIEQLLPLADHDRQDKIMAVKRQLENLDLELDGSGSQSTNDPDTAKRLVAESKNIRVAIGQLENSLKQYEAKPALSDGLIEIKSDLEELLEEDASEEDLKAMEALNMEFERASAKNDERTLKRLEDAYKNLYFKVLSKSDGFWFASFNSLKEGYFNFVNASAAKELLRKGNLAMSNLDVATLKPIVLDLFKLLPKDEMEKEQEKAMRAGIRRH